MGLRRVGARRLDPHVEDLEREDRQAIDHRAGGLRVVPRVGRGHDAGEPLEQRLVDLLDRVVAALVVAVDRALVRRDRRVRDIAPARAVLLVPQQAIVAVVRLDPGPDARAASGRRRRPPSAFDRRVVERADRRRSRRPRNRFRLMRPRSPVRSGARLRTGASAASPARHRSADPARPSRSRYRSTCCSVIADGGQRQHRAPRVGGEAAPAVAGSCSDAM